MSEEGERRGGKDVLNGLGKTSERVTVVEVDEGDVENDEEMDVNDDGDEDEGEEEEEEGWGRCPRGGERCEEQPKRRLAQLQFWLVALQSRCETATNDKYVTTRRRCRRRWRQLII